MVGNQFTLLYFRFAVVILQKNLIVHLSCHIHLNIAFLMFLPEHFIIEDHRSRMNGTVYWITTVCWCAGPWRSSSEGDCKTYLTMKLANSQKEDITINRTAKWELPPQTYKLSCDSSWGLTSAWEIKYPGSRCSCNQWCYFLYFKLPLAVGAVLK